LVEVCIGRIRISVSPNKNDTILIFNHRSLIWWKWQTWTCIVKKLFNNVLSSLVILLKYTQSNTEWM
jgi:hypothetical protein